MKQAMYRLCAHIILTAAILSATVPGYAQVGVDNRLAPGQPPIVIAHRSADLDGLPENSLAWIQRAIDRRVDMVHINPQLTRDDRYVLMHDPTLNRMTDVEAVFPEGPPDGPSRKQRAGKDFVRDYSLDQIRQLHLVPTQGNDSHTVPSLEEALDLIGGRTLVLLGLKNYEVGSLAAALSGFESQNMLLFELYFSGTDQSKLRALSEKTGIGVAVSLFRSRDYLADLEDIRNQLGKNLRMVNVNSSQVTPDLVTRLAKMGVVLVISGPTGPEDAALVSKNDPSKWQNVLESGFSASTDQPDLVLRLLDR